MTAMFVADFATIESFLNLTPQDIAAYVTEPPEVPQMPYAEQFRRDFPMPDVKPAVEPCPVVLTKDMPPSVRVKHLLFVYERVCEKVLKQPPAFRFSTCPERHTSFDALLEFSDAIIEAGVSPHWWAIGGFIAWGRLRYKNPNLTTTAPRPTWIFGLKTLQDTKRRAFSEQASSRFSGREMRISSTHRNLIQTYQMSQDLAITARTSQDYDMVAKALATLPTATSNALERNLYLQRVWNESTITATYKSLDL
jgi:hypothetical protein